jgi:DNA-binding GntR family transcriptional regulator
MTISQSIYQTLKSKIILHELPPATQLKEEQIAKMLQVTRTPIREAIIKLEREGLVTIRSNVGAFVVKLSEKDIDDILEVRKALEIRAAYIAINIAGRDEFERVNNTLKGREKFLKGDKNEKFDYPGVDFHHDLILLSKNKKLIQFWELLDAQLKWSG